MVGSVMVIGGGIAGMQASLDLADSGFKVYLVDKSPTIGGVMAQLDKTFPTLDCSMCIMAPKLVSTGRHHNIQLLTNADIMDVDGEPGNLTVEMRIRPRYVNHEKCTGCGLCAQYCPVEAANEYDSRLTMRRGIFVDYPQAVPLIYAIDREKCIGCGLCENICQANAIEYDQKETRKSINVGSIILAAGFDEFEPQVKKEYGYGRFKNVVTATEFERILSASGPFAGHVARPSDGEVPRTIAFLQCVGSRDEKSNKYCSAVCCMYATKEAIIAKEHDPDLEAAIFFMDMRTYGKGFESFYKRAQDEYGLQYIRSRVPCIEEDPDTGNLIVTYETETGEIRKESFDMVVLSVGLEPPRSNKELSEVLHVPLNEFGFLDWKIFEPLQARLGVYSCGAISGPKDIPDTVAQASGAAAMASSIISNERNSLVEEKIYPEEIDVSDQPPRIGVFVCWCGINIGGTVNVPQVMEYAASLPNVVYADQNLYTCSQDTQEKIKQAVEEHNLNRVVVASCTPRTHEPLFQSTIREAGLNPYLFEMTNIRDQCSWVHMHTPQKATEKAKDLVRMAVARANLLEPLRESTVDVTQSALVIGGGIAGMTAALGLANQGFPAYLVEKKDTLGGLVRDIHSTLTGEDPGAYLEDIEQQLREHPLVHIFMETQVEKIEGYVGNFTTTLSNEKEITHGAVIVATGGKEHQPTEYLYGKDKRVVTQLELEKMLSEGLDTDTDTNTNTIVMINCVESRTESREYCSRVCCSEAIKNALAIKEQNPDARIYILYRDMRTYAFRETYYDQAREKGIVFMRYDPDTAPQLEKEGGNLVLYAHDSALNEDFKISPDLVVLSTGISPSDNLPLSQMLKVPLDKDGFFLEAHMKLRPVEFATDGVFMAGLAHSPKFIDETISQAYGAVSRACTIISKNTIGTEPIVAEVNEDLCCGCAVCIPLCPYNARELDEEKKIAKVNEVLCKGCGACVAACPSGAAQQKHFRDTQLLSMIETSMRR